MSDVRVVEQELSRKCIELSDKKADKELVHSLVNAVSASPLCLDFISVHVISFTQFCTAFDAH